MSIFSSLFSKSPCKELESSVKDILKMAFPKSLMYSLTSDQLQARFLTISSGSSLFEAMKTGEYNILNSRPDINLSRLTNKLKSTHDLYVKCKELYGDEADNIISQTIQKYGSLL